MGPPMLPTLEALGIDQLPIADRLALIEQIWDSLPEPSHRRTYPIGT